MTILVTDNKSIISEARRHMPNLIVVDDLLILQIELDKADEYNMLIIDWDLVGKETNCIKTIISYIIKQNKFIKHIMFYYNSYDITLCNELITKLNKARYKTNIIKQKQLIKGLSSL
jgi:hypothetical protein